MKKFFEKLIAHPLALTILFVMTVFILPLGVQAQDIPPPPIEIVEATSKATINPVTIAGNWVVEGLIVNMVAVILRFIAMLVGISATLLNGVIYYTIVNIKDNYDKLTPILESWKVLRDIANMSFVFVLLYAAIRTILGVGQDNKKIIVNVIVVAVLLNFSLFFTRVVIDISNVFALTFYDAIAPGALNATAGFNWTQAGLATAFTNALHLQGLYDIGNSNLNAGTIITIGLMGSIMLIIAGFIFLAVTIMFVIRYAVLILVLILSPVAFIAYALPKGAGVDDYQKQWQNALLGQAFFAPIYFLLTWVSLRVLSGVMQAFGQGSKDISVEALTKLSTGGEIVQANIEGAFLMFMNFAIVIVLLIVSLLQAVKWANKTGGGMSKLTSWATGAAGGMTMGMAGRFGRNTLGRAGLAVGESETMKRALEWSNKRGGLVGAASGFSTRLGIAAARKTGGASFDARATGFGGTLGAGKAGGKGGFADYRKKKAEDEEKFAKTLGPSEKTIAKAEKALKDAKTDEEKRVAQTRLNELKGIGDKEVKQKQKEIDTEKKTAIENDADVMAERDLLERIKNTENELIKAKKKDNMDEYQRLARRLSELNDEKEGVEETAKASSERIEREYETRKAEIKKVEGAFDARKKAFANSVENSIWAKFRGYNYEAAAKIRKGKSAKDKLADAAKELSKEEGAAEEETPTPPTPPPAPSAPPTP